MKLLAVIIYLKVMYEQEPFSQLAQSPQMENHFKEPISMVKYI